MNRPNELYHHGILGQKWGVRRYQNEDGTLTSAGKQRQANAYPEVSGGEIAKASGKAAIKSAVATAILNKALRGENISWGEVTGLAAGAAVGGAVMTALINNGRNAINRHKNKQLNGG